MKILLISPINRSFVVMPSLGLGYLASIMIENGHSVKILDCKKEKTSYSDFAQFIRNEHFDLIGFQVFTYDLNSVKEHISIIRKVSFNTIVIAGGPQPSGDPLGTMDFLESLDFAIKGEAEIGLPMLLNCLTTGSNYFSNIPGLVWRNQGCTIEINPSQNVQNLDEIPIPAWDVLRPETYPEAPHGAFTKNFPTAPIIISRGCPCKCTYCSGSSVSGETIRRRSVDNVITELKILKERGIREFHIEDENFTSSKTYVHDFCKRLEIENIGMSWSLPSGVRLDTLTREMLLEMQRSGCYSLAVGIESGSDRILCKTKKGISVEMIINKLHIFLGTDIKITGFFMFGIPGESIDEMKQTVKLALSLPIHRAQFNNFMPLPGSSEWMDLNKGGRLGKITDWEHYFVHDVASYNGSIPANKLNRIRKLAVLQFYLRPKIIYGLFKEIRSYRHLKYLIKRLFDTLR